MSQTEKGLADKKQQLGLSVAPEQVEEGGRRLGFFFGVWVVGSNLLSKRGTA